MDALKIDKAIIGGLIGEHGQRTSLECFGSNACKAMVSVSGYLISGPERTRHRCRHKLNWRGGTNFYFATDVVAQVMKSIRRDFNKLIWQISFAQNGSSMTPHSIAAQLRLIILTTSKSYIHSIRWRIGLAEGEPKMTTLKVKLAAASGYLLCRPSRWK
jgi:hypothetical protein